MVREERRKGSIGPTAWENRWAREYVKEELTKLGGHGQIGWKERVRKW